MMPLRCMVGSLQRVQDLRRACARHAGLPVRQRQAEGLLQLVRGQPRIERARGRRRVGAGGNGADGVGRHADRLAVGARPFDDEARVVEPVRLAAGHAVVGAGQRRLGQHAPHGVRGHVGQQFGAGGRADLVADDLERVALGGQPQHGAREVAAARGIDPARAQDQVAAAAGADELLRLRAWCGRRRSRGRWARLRRAARCRCRRRHSRCCSAPAARPARRPRARARPAPWR